MPVLPSCEGSRCPRSPAEARPSREHLQRLSYRCRFPTRRRRGRYPRRLRPTGTCRLLSLRVPSLLRRDTRAVSLSRFRRGADRFLARRTGDRRRVLLARRSDRLPGRRQELFPSAPKTRSLPLPARMMSSPRPPWMTSSPPRALMWSTQPCPPDHIRTGHADQRVFAGRSFDRACRCSRGSRRAETVIYYHSPSSERHRIVPVCLSRHCVIGFRRKDWLPTSVQATATRLDS